MRRRFSTYLGRQGASPSPTDSSLKHDSENWRGNLDSTLDESETEVEEVCFETRMAFDEVTSPVLAYKFSGQDFDPEKCK